MSFQPAIRTTHFATIEFLFDDSVKHLSDKYFDVLDKLAARAEQIAKKYPEVRVNSNFCTQAEGREFVGSDADDVRKAGEEFARYLGRFSGVRPIH